MMLRSILSSELHAAIRLWVTYNITSPRQFLSSGFDLVVQTWEIPDPDDEHQGLNPMRPCESTILIDHARPHSRGPLT